jgi:hypothetical protein
MSGKDDDYFIFERHVTGRSTLVTSFDEIRVMPTIIALDDLVGVSPFKGPSDIVREEKK